MGTADEEAEITEAGGGGLAGIVRKPIVRWIALLDEKARPVELSEGGHQSC
ncbi:hypothetical protein [Actinomadura hibisca]|uniref:hypothetical protein n=1 Tax=Actinomadura hibisca TaxID=68565 RepID=UPI0012F7A3C0|nr:hypothetical protein [Actinomadura hibisca]